MESELVVTIGAEIVDEQRSQWCPSCALPSVFVYRIAYFWAHSLSVFKWEEQRLCDECGTHTVSPVSR